LLDQVEQDRKQFLLMLGLFLSVWKNSHSFLQILISNLVVALPALIIIDYEYDFSLPNLFLFLLLILFNLLVDRKKNFRQREVFLSEKQSELEKGLFERIINNFESPFCSAVMNE
jgi:hypothetical protein